MKGLIFDIKEFAIHDGSGIRSTVFFKGCPLRCVWCHNPEGLSFEKQLSVKKNGCLHCGLCRKPCAHPECQPFGRCLHICPNNLLDIVGKEWEADDLANLLLKRTDLYEHTGGGITLSGGEPLAQSEFVCELIGKLKGKVHIAIETSGYASTEVFQKVVSQCDFVYMDLKLMDKNAHLKYTGKDNERILKNAEWLKQSGIPHTFRTPLIPLISDTEENKKAIESFVGNDAHEFLAYNSLAGAKYPQMRMKFGYEKFLSEKNNNK